MKNIDKAKTLIDSNASFLAEWLERARKVRELEPHVQQAYANTIWQRDSLHAVPDNAPDLSTSMVTSLENSRNVFESYLPQIQKAPSQYSDVTSFNAPVVAGSTNTFIYLTEISPNLPQHQQNTINSQIALYIELQRKQDRMDTVKTLLHQLNQDLISELELSEKELLHFKNGTADVLAPAYALRNVLQHFKGQLFLKARNTPKDTPNWTDMAKRLAIRGVSSPEHSTLEAEGHTHTHLYNRLSLISKGNLEATSADIENILIEVVDHFYTVLSLIKM